MYGIPADSQHIKLPYSEVCCHMGVAGKQMWVAPIGARFAQLYTDDGDKFSFPITRGEAGFPERHNDS